MQQSLITLLLDNYLSWEMIAMKTPDPDERLKRMRKSLKLTLLPFTDRLKDDDAPTNIVSLFSKSSS